MLLFLIFFVLLSAVAAAAVISIFRKSEKSLPPLSETTREFQPIQYQSIFAPSEEELRAFEAEDKARHDETLRREILAKAESEDFNALIEAKDFGDEFYSQVLKELTFRSDSPKFAALGAFIEENKLQTNAEFINRFRQALETSAGKKDVIRLLHFAALSQSAELFFDSIENVVKLCREDRLEGFTQTDLIRLAESQFWLLPAAEKTSGAGFLLKQKLAKLREEVLEKR